MTRPVKWIPPFCVLLVLCRCPAPAQTAQSGALFALTGRVTSYSGGQGIPGATVVLVGTGRGVKTDPGGGYTIAGIRAGSYTARVRALHYRAVMEKIVVDSAGPAVGNFVLQRSPAEPGEPWAPDSLRGWEDISRGTIHLVLNTGIAGASFTEEEVALAAKYGIIYDIRGCTNSETGPGLTEYYKVVFAHLDSAYGNAWRRDLGKGLLPALRK
jgi:hypothetical protein